jgi:hypothetical protein
MIAAPEFSEMSSFALFHLSINFLYDYTGRSISSGPRPNEEEEAKSVEWDDFVRSFRPRFETSGLFG